jgi:hypothetical protein
MKTPPNRLNGEKHEMPPAGRRYVKAAFIKVTVLSSTTLGTIAKVRCETYQLVWSVATRIEPVNHLGTDINHLLSNYVHHLLK